jgi:hypothetical protein
MEEKKMKKWTFTLTLVLVFVIGNSGMVNASAKHAGHGSAGNHETTGHGSMAAVFSHEAVVQGVRAEFQVMSLAEMNMNDPEGNTHHVMVKFFDQTTKEQIKKAVGKIKIITPSGHEQVSNLEDYSGVFAANFTAGETGKYGIISLFKIGEKKRVVKFWYEHRS